MSCAKSHSPPSSRSLSTYSSAMSDIASWRFFTAAGLNQSLVTLRCTVCSWPSMCTSVCGVKPIPSSSCCWMSGMSTEWRVLCQMSLRRETSNTSAWRVSA